ncbi:hypothetical protein MRX96_044622 [Rhipicephalus microplus]
MNWRRQRRACPYYVTARPLPIVCRYTFPLLQPVPLSARQARGFSLRKSQPAVTPEVDLSPRSRRNNFDVGGLLAHQGALRTTYEGGGRNCLRAVSAPSPLSA